MSDSAASSDDVTLGDIAEQEMWEEHTLERMTGVSPCFVNCGEPACQKLGCVRVYNARHANG